MRRITKLAKFVRVIGFTPICTKYLYKKILSFKVFRLVYYVSDTNLIPGFYGEFHFRINQLFFAQEYQVV